MGEYGYFPVLLSLQVASVATLLNLVIGGALAYVLARHRFPGRDLLESLTSLPLVLPPTVLGYYLLVTLGRQGIGPWLEDTFGLALVFTWRGAVVAATISALPLFVQSAQAGLARVETEIEEAARIDGASRWQRLWYITLRLAWQGIFAGVVLSFLRALGDFGATLMVAGNIPGRTQTMAIAIYDASQVGEIGQVNQMVLLVTVLTIGLLLVSRRLTRGLAY